MTDAGYPNWNADLPMPLYTFLEEYDFSGKTIIPFVTHGGSGFSGTINTIKKIVLTIFIFWLNNIKGESCLLSGGRKSVRIAFGDSTWWLCFLA